MLMVIAMVVPMTETMMTTIWDDNYDGAGADEGDYLTLTVKNAIVINHDGGDGDDGGEHGHEGGYGDDQGDVDVDVVSHIDIWSCAGVVSRMCGVLHHGAGNQSSGERKIPK